MRVTEITLPTPLWTAEELAEVTGGHWGQAPPRSWLPTGITYMRRLSLLRPGDIYVTMDSRTRRRAERKQEDPGKVWDTADRLPELVAAGVSAIIAQREISSVPPGLPLLHVADSHQAVLDLARVARSRLRGHVTAVTGTVGKSTTKEMLRHVLARQGPTFATMANFNTYFGVPLSLAQTSRDARYAVYEVALASLYKRAGPISQLVRPHAAIFTAIGRGLEAHVNSMEDIADLKARIFRGLEPDGAAIINRDMPLFERVEARAREYGASRIVRFGQHPDADIRLVDIDLRPDHSRVTVSAYGEPVEYEVPLPGRAMVMNTLAVLAAVHVADGDWRQAAADLASYETRDGRLRRFRVPLPDGDFELIDDSFNAEQASMIANLEVLSLAQPRPGGRRIAVLGQIGNLTNPEQTHAELAEPILEYGVDKVFTLGDELVHLRRRLPKRLLGAHAQSARELAAAVLEDVRPGDVVSAKGCSITGNFDKVVSCLRAGQPVAASGMTAKRRSHDAGGPGGTASRPESLGLPAVTDALRVADIGIRSRRKVDICFVGDTYFGEHYQARRAKKGRLNYLEAHGYSYSLRFLRPFLHRADLAVANLEATLTTRTRSPLAGKKDWILGGKPRPTLRALQGANIGIVALGNNHLMDYGQVGLAETMAALDKHGMHRFGAGANAAEADRPLSISVSLGDRSIELSLFSAYQYIRTHDQALRAYAGPDQGGVACLSTELLEKIAALKHAHPDRFVVVSPHWGKNYKWRSNEQAEIADWLIAAGTDLIIGHGAHMMQEIERRSGRWVIYSLGNFIFNSEGEYSREGAVPYSLLARLRLAHEAQRIAKFLYLYPIVSDNRATLFRPRFVDAREFATVVRRLVEHGPGLDLGDPDVATGRDEHGWYIQLAVDASPGFTRLRAASSRDRAFHAAVSGSGAANSPYPRNDEILC